MSLAGLGPLVLLLIPEVAGGIAAGGATIGTLTSVYGTRTVMKAQTYFNDKETSHKGTWKATAFKVAKWVAIAGAALIGTVGVLLATTSTFVLLLSMTIAVKIPALLLLGITTAVFFATACFTGREVINPLLAQRDSAVQRQLQSVG